MATDLAQQLVKTGDIVRSQPDASRFFTRDMQINFASPRVIVVYATMRGYPEQGSWRRCDIVLAFKTHHRCCRAHPGSRHLDRHVFLGPLHEVPVSTVAGASMLVDAPRGAFVPAAQIGRPSAVSSAGQRLPEYPVR
ncbi:MAG TPA: hypothetical protein VEN30_07515, partial [Paraburkholderia sp.]|nr:hypothetical protein [Paraburkholderia sp.]